MGRFLEHSRVFWFRNGGSEEIYLGSADLMGRNLDRRVEILFPVLDPRLVRQVKSEVLDTCLLDTAKARTLHADGSYGRAETPSAGGALDCQAELIKRRLPAALRT